MKLGLLADIHEHTGHLSTALSLFNSESVDQVVFVGDLVEMGPGVKDVCRMLKAAGVIGVWGNHDFGLCFEPTAKTIEKYGQPALDFMRTLKPRLVIDDCYVAHVEPWLDPEVLEDLWYFEGPVDAAGRVDRVFDVGSSAHHVCRPLPSLAACHSARLDELVRQKTARPKRRPSLCRNPRRVRQSVCHLRHSFRRAGTVCLLTVLFPLARVRTKTRKAGSAQRSVTWHDHDQVLLTQILER